MREGDFRRRYDAMQRGVEAPEEVVERTRRLIAEQRSWDAAGCSSSGACVPSHSVSSEGGRARQMAASGKPSMRRAPGRAKSVPGKRPAKRFAVTAVAACMVAGLVAFGFAALPAVRTTADESPFAVKAYAATTESVFDAGTTASGRIVFPFDRKIGLQGGGVSANELYTGIMFTVEGDGVERIQATLSRGEIYSYAVEDFLVADNPEKAAEAGNWQPKVVGTGTYYGGYDFVMRTSGPEGYGDDPYAHVRTIKRLGKTIDVPVMKDAANCWGLWLDVGVEQGTEDSLRIHDAIINLEAMEGEILTVTAQMADGSFQTQVIELHAGWFKGESVMGAEGVSDTLPVGEPLGIDEVEPFGNFVHTLYGTLQSVSDTPHPYPLDDANRYADEIAPTRAGIENALDFQGTIEVLEGVPESDAVVDANAAPVVIRRETIYDDGHENRDVDIALSNLACEVTSVLPESIDLQEDTTLKGFLGNIEYMNKCRMTTHRWAVDESGALNEGNSYVVVEYDLVNESDEEVLVSATMGALCAIDGEADRTVFATSGVFGVADTGWHDTANEFDRAYRGVYLKPGEVNHVTVAYIAEDAVAKAESLALMVSPDTRFLYPEYEDDAPSVHELQFVRLK